ncbi:MAG: hypothetical protein J6S18_03060, partial [Oscillospiraceae bacterium]|nr:hypothetical protein [Oscillospiraceae bacterium]
NWQQKFVSASIDKIPLSGVYGYGIRFRYYEIPGYYLEKIQLRRVARYEFSASYLQRTGF